MTYDISLKPVNTSVKFVPHTTRLNTTMSPVGHLLVSRNDGHVSSLLPMKTNTTFHILITPA